MYTIKKDPNLTGYTRELMEVRIANEFASFIGNQSQAIIKIFEDNYLKPGTADDDHLAWLQFIVDVSITSTYLSETTSINNPCFCKYF